MCNGSSTRVSQGGALAILRSPERAPGTDYRVTLQQTDDVEGRLTGNILPPQENSNNTSSYQDLKACWLEIHRDGDLIPSLTRDAIPALYRLELNSLVRRNGSQRAASATLDSDQPIRLTVGDDGVIGRRMSIVDGRSGSKIAEGVIGWN